MNLFWLEYLHFIVAIFAILVSISTAVLFFVHSSDQRITSMWRAIGFSALALAFFLFILERKFPGVGIAATGVELFGFFGIYRGVTADLSLAHLRKKGGAAAKHKHPKKRRNKKAEQRSLMGSIATLIVLAVIFVLGYVFYSDYLSSFLVGVSIIFIVATIRLQIKRYREGGSDRASRLQNIWPLAGYVFFLYRAVAVIFARLPDLDVVVLRELKIDYSGAWQVGVWFALVAFLFLAIWAWNFIKLHSFVRTYVTFITIVVMISALGSLIFTQLIFGVVERNNLDLMHQGAQTQNVLAEDRQDTALFVARTIATNPEIISQLEASDFDGVLNTADQSSRTAGVDILRIYNEFGEVVVSPSDNRDEMRVFNEDPLVSFALLQRSQVKTFDVESGVLTPLVVTRALYPILDGDDVVGVVEAGYKLDNAFVDFSKDETGLDTTVYTGDTRSATTINTLDGVSRWIGSKETNQDVLDAVLTDDTSFATITDRLGIIYYSAYIPVHGVNGEVIGMFSVGVPTVELFEDTRQQLISAFLLVTVFSLIAAGIGFVAIRSFRKVRV